MSPQGSCPRVRGCREPDTTVPLQDQHSWEALRKCFAVWQPGWRAPLAREESLSRPPEPYSTIPWRGPRRACSARSPDRTRTSRAKSPMRGAAGLSVRPRCCGTLFRTDGRCRRSSPPSAPPERSARYIRRRTALPCRVRRATSGSDISFCARSLPPECGASPESARRACP